SFSKGAVCPHRPVMTNSRMGLRDRGASSRSRTSSDSEAGSPEYTMANAEILTHLFWIKSRHLVHEQPPRRGLHGEQGHRRSCFVKRVAIRRVIPCKGRSRN